MPDFGGNSYAMAEEVSSEERTWAMFAHLGTMIGSAIPLGNILAPLVIWLMHKDKSEFVGKHARESLAFQVGVMVASLALIFFVMMTMGRGIILAVLAILALVIANLLYMIVGTVRANEGKIWEYPITTRFVA
jgi:uncharacterized Tic20 family protein